MNGREKSDPAIVARKLPNGAGQPAEEAVERRACPWHEQGAGAEGNAGQHRTHRTQIRERVGSPHSSTMSIQTPCWWRSTRCSAERHRASMG